MQNSFKPKQTAWVVITGAPSSGKTSVIEELARRGFAVQTEAARELIDKLLKKGRKIEQIRDKDHIQNLQRLIIALQLSREKSLDPDRRVFMDRGLGDSITYFRLAGTDPSGLIKESSSYHYQAVFIFDRLEIRKDEVRTESEQEALQIDKMLEADYIALGYQPVRVPVMPVAARADFILQNLRPNAASTVA